MPFFPYEGVVEIQKGPWKAAGGRGRPCRAVDSHGYCHDRVMMPFLMREKTMKERMKDYDMRKKI